ncbi:hypothetical protein K1T71_012161 [Dendrolimus kikuchii]|uniref:Uncharacterized protein n=1 Tax=Dendrolimus kikuchii TaxID=765133 RepID=A0ACC1CKR9_9NEOP|nr:hypothetical protein K1T71_012161 [Dendrolimus kikuchii]
MCKARLIFSLLLCTIVTVDCVEKRWFNGTDLRSHIHKYLVKLITEVEIENTTNSGNVLCSGSIIKPHWVISAAHCFKNAVKVEVHHLTAGLLSIIKNSNIFNRDDNVAVNKISNDLALLKTSNRIKFGKYIQPIQLATVFIKIGTTGIVAGFGESENKEFEAKEGLVEISPCPKNLRRKLICSYDIVRAGSGDSGGPLIANGRLVGVVSSGCDKVQIPKSCFTFYVDVVAHLDWITRIFGSMFS